MFLTAEWAQTPLLSRLAVGDWVAVIAVRTDNVDGSKVTTRPALFPFW